MKHQFFLNLAATFVFFLAIVGCEKETKSNDTGSVNLRIKLKFGEEDFQMFKEYPYPDSNKPFYMSRLSFFMAKLRLESGSESIALSEIDYLNVTPEHTPPIKPFGFEKSFENVKVGDYNRLVFGVGVPADKNAKQPKDYPASDILSSTAEYWTSWKSYIFFRPEGQIALGNQSTPEDNFTLHLGGDEAYREIKMDKPIKIQAGQTTNVDLVFDVAKFFKGKSLYNIESVQSIHSLNQKSLIEILADNLPVAFR